MYFVNRKAQYKKEPARGYDFLTKVRQLYSRHWESVKPFENDTNSYGVRKTV